MYSSEYRILLFLQMHEDQHVSWPCAEAPRHEGRRSGSLLRNVGYLFLCNLFGFHYRGGFHRYGYTDLECLSDI